MMFLSQNIYHIPLSIAGYGETRFVQGKTRKLAKDGLLHLHLPL
jgi:hypothetical protein